MAALPQDETGVGCENSLPQSNGVARLLRRLRCERGTIMIETALTFMILMTMVLGLIECSMLAYTYAVLEDAAREGVHYAGVHGSDSPSCSGPSSGCDASAAAVVTDVKNYASTYAGNLNGISVVVTYPDSSSTGTSRVTVTITQTYQPVFHFPGTAQTITVSASGRILY